MYPVMKQYVIVMNAAGINIKTANLNSRRDISTMTNANPAPNSKKGRLLLLTTPVTLVKTPSPRVTKPTAFKGTKR